MKKNRKKTLRERTNLEICQTNGLQYPLVSNVAEEAISDKKIRSTFEIISKVLCGTLGPYGSTSIVQSRDKHHIITKDGYDICNRLDFQDPIANTILDIIRSVASNQVQAVGDGSTSSIIVAAALYVMLQDAQKNPIFNKCTPKDFTSMLKELSKYINRDIQDYATPISKDMHELVQIATIATNNDAESGKFIADLYKKVGRFGFISTDVIKKCSHDEADVKSGVEWKRGAIDSCYFIGNPQKKIIYDEEPVVFITRSELNYKDVKELLSEIIGKVCGSARKNLLIIANGYDGSVENFLKLNRTKHLSQHGMPEMNYTAVDIETVTTISNNNIEDIAMILGCEVYDKLQHKPDDFSIKPERFLGTASKVIITETSTQVIGGTLPKEKQEKIDKAVKEFNKRLETLLKIETPDFKQEHEIFELKTRLANLTDSTIIVNVGGESLAERVSRERLIEDAILACRSALQHGYIFGGNLVVPFILNDKLSKYALDLAAKFSIGIDTAKVFIELTKDAFLESYRNVLNNSYMKNNPDKLEETVKYALDNSNGIKNAMIFNLKTGRYEYLDKTTVINSVQTDIEIMNSAISIIGILGVSNQFIGTAFVTSNN